ncbi:hypothetical protein [Umezawaea beigongshangensis]|uniref:hypothetical protein n=1 Tax=Umezawaea beigongshangensis TaxID=2780383 RepID=UPI0018F20F53|nr:hypothetical protein [Umezawaea beigongshangensis]
MGVNRVEVHVDELVLTGFGRVDGDLVVRAFQRELTRLLDGDETSVARVCADVVDDLPALPRTGSARQLGRALARSVHTGLKRGTR